MIVSLKNEYRVHSGDDIDSKKSFRIIYDNFFILMKFKYVFALVKSYKFMLFIPFLKKLLYTTTLCF